MEEQRDRWMRDKVMERGKNLRMEEGVIESRRNGQIEACMYKIMDNQ